MNCSLLKKGFSASQIGKRAVFVRDLSLTHFLASVQRYCHGGPHESSAGKTEVPLRTCNFARKVIGRLLIWLGQLKFGAFFFQTMPCMWVQTFTFLVCFWEKTAFFAKILHTKWASCLDFNWSHRRQKTSRRIGCQHVSEGFKVLNHDNFQFFSIPGKRGDTST